MAWIPHGLEVKSSLKQDMKNGTPKPTPSARSKGSLPGLRAGSHNDCPFSYVTLHMVRWAHYLHTSHGEMGTNHFFTNVAHLQPP